MTPERLAELKKYCKLWDGKDYKGFEIKEILWLIAEVERLQKRLDDEGAITYSEWLARYGDQYP
jgi:hypothetical protein